MVEGINKNQQTANTSSANEVCSKRHSASSKDTSTGVVKGRRISVITNLMAKACTKATAAMDKTSELASSSFIDKMTEGKSIDEMHQNHGVMSSAIIDRVQEYRSETKKSLQQTKKLKLLSAVGMIFQGNIRSGITGIKETNKKYSDKKINEMTSSSVKMKENQFASYLENKFKNSL